MSRLRPQIHIDHYTDDSWAVVDCNQPLGEHIVAESFDGEAMIAALRLLGGVDAVRHNVAYLEAIGCRSPHTLLDMLRGTGAG